MYGVFDINPIYSSYPRDTNVTLYQPKWPIPTQTPKVTQVSIFQSSLCVVYPLLVAFSSPSNHYSKASNNSENMV